MEIFGIFVGIVLTFIVLRALYIFGTISKTKITVSEKGLWISGGGDAPVTSFHLIHTKDGKIFNNINSLFMWKLHSDELQGKLKIGKTYMIKYYGLRIGFLNIRPNIVSIVKEIKK